MIGAECKQTKIIGANRLHSTASHLKQVLKTPVSAGRDAVEVENLVADALKVKLENYIF